jgi:hypothetical protein
MQRQATVQKIAAQMGKIRGQLLRLGAFHPGSISQQYHYCQKAGCKCQHPQTPQPHGPYAKLTYVFHGKSQCRFVRAESVAEMTTLVANYKTFRQLIDQWVALSIRKAQMTMFADRKPTANRRSTLTPRPKGRKKHLQT